MLRLIKRQLESPLAAQFHQEFRFSRLLPNVAVGLTTGAIGVLFDLSFAALIFSGGLSSHLSFGVGLVLFSAAATRIAIALSSSLPGMVADLGTVPTAILAWSAGAIAKNLAAAPPTEVLVTVLAAIAATSLLTGVCLLAMGMLRVGELVRTVPYPVVGGFVASTGWLLIKGGFKVMTDQPLGFVQLPSLIQTDVLLQWLPGLLLAVYLLTLSHRHTHPLAMPASLLASVGLFYVLLSLTGTSPAQASAQGWLLQVSNPQGWQPLRLSDFAQVHWAAIADQATCIATVIVTAAISLLMNVSGLELVADRAIDSNRELKIAGYTNLAIGMTGGILSYHSLSKSILAHKMGGKSRLVTLVGALVFLAAPVMGSSLLSYFPKPVLGGLLLFLGLSLLLEGVYAAWFRFSKPDYLIVQLIWIVSGTVGFLQGLTLGWVVAAVLFVVKYSRLYAVQADGSGSSYPSTIDRSVGERQQLQAESDRLYVLELRGFVFFGTAHSLVHQIQRRLTNPDRQPVQFLILDFRRVPEIDASAILSFKRIKQLTAHHQITLILTHLNPSLEAALCRSDFDLYAADVQRFATLEDGLVWWEDQLLVRGTDPV